MAHFNLRFFMEALGKQRGEDITLLQIGAMDGSTFDPVHEYITRYGWNGLLVEPISEQFARLQATYASQPQLQLVQAAIADFDGTATMHRVPASAVEQQHVPKWGLGAASFYTDRNALGFSAAQPHLSTEEVCASTLATLLSQHPLQRIDVLQIDTEGHDYHILRQFDFARYKPYVINMELVNLPKDEQSRAKLLLDAAGYLHSKAGYDLLAVHPDFFREIYV